MSIEIPTPPNAEPPQDGHEAIDNSSLIDFQPLWRETISMAVKETAETPLEELVRQSGFHYVGLIATQQATKHLKDSQ